MKLAWQVFRIVISVNFAIPQAFQWATDLAFQIVPLWGWNLRRTVSWWQESGPRCARKRSSHLQKLQSIQLCFPELVYCLCQKMYKYYSIKSLTQDWCFISRNLFIYSLYYYEKKESEHIICGIKVIPQKQINLVKLIEKPLNCCKSPFGRLLMGNNLTRKWNFLKLRKLMRLGFNKYPVNTVF